MKSLVNFADSALSRTEMKLINGGGTCMVQTKVSGKAVGGYTMSEAKRLAGMWGPHWCCTGCSTASWT